MSNLSSTSKLVFAFVLLIIGAVFVGVIATQGLTNTQKTFINAESHDATTCFASNGTVDQVNEGDATCEVTVTNNPTGWKVLECPLDSVVVTNGTAVDIWTLDTDYTLTASNGSILLLNTTTTQHLNEEANTTAISYEFCQDTYLVLDWSRSILNLVAGFFALAVLGASLMLFYSIGKDEGIW